MPSANMLYGQSAEVFFPGVRTQDPIQMASGLEQPEDSNPNIVFPFVGFMIALLLLRLAYEFAD